MKGNRFFQLAFLYSNSEGITACIQAFDADRDNAEVGRAFVTSNWWDRSQKVFDIVGDITAKEAIEVTHWTKART